jgi:hypothetical protein
MGKLKNKKKALKKYKNKLLIENELLKNYNKLLFRWYEDIVMERKIIIHTGMEGLDNITKMFTNV